jgi:anti-anti-sigma factor
VDLDRREIGSTCCLKVKRKLRFGEEVDTFNAAVASALETGHPLLVLDLSAMPVIDSCGIGAVVQALQQAKKLGGDLRLVDPSPFAMKTFKMTGILPLFQVFPTEAEALEA